MAENYDLIFGQNASQQYAWNDADYQKGWETIGNIPPTAAQFDALQRRSDTKLKELNDELTPLVNADTADSRQPSTTYSEGDIKYSSLLPTGWFLACTTAGTTSASELVLPTPIAEGDTVTDGEVVWEIHKIGSAANGGGGVPPGAILPFAGNGAVPAGYLLCDGSAVSRTMFPDLFSAIGTTYGAGDGSTTFNLPNYADGKFPEGSTVAGTEKKAGLPNITGSTGETSNIGNWGAGSVGSGAINVTALSHGNSGVTDGKLYTGNVINIDASLSNSIYGNSNTVQPYSCTTRYIIKAFDGQTPDSALTDITQYAQELAGKADRALDNLSADEEDHFLENGFTIIYPNGGSEASPANVAVNSRYVESNPFPGYYVHAVAEVKYNNRWCDSGFIYASDSGGGWGVKATHLMPDDNIIVQTGNLGTVAIGTHGGTGLVLGDTNTPLPCRVKIWKIGKILTA